MESFESSDPSTCKFSFEHFAFAIMDAAKVLVISISHMNYVNVTGR